MSYTFDNSVVVTANGMNFTSWESVQVRREFGNPVSCFELVPTEGDKLTVSQKMKPGDLVNISFGGQPAFYGIVSTREVSYSDRSHNVVILGKSITSKAAQGSIPVQQGTYDGQTLEQAASSVLQPLGINFQVSGSGDGVDKPFDSCKVQYGESPLEFVSRLAAMRNVFLSDDVSGNLVATRLGSGASGATGTFVEGSNILYARAHMENDSYADSITVAGQQPGSDQNYPTRAIAATATNAGYGSTGINALLVAEHPGDSQDMAMRADHENIVQMWPIFTVTVGVVGWTNDCGSLWDCTTETVVSIYSPMLFPAGAEYQTMSLQSVTLKQDNASGSTTELTMVPHVNLSNTSGYTDGSSGNPASDASPQPAQPDQPDQTIST